MMQSTETAENRAQNAGTEKTQAQPDLKNQEMPSTNRTTIFSKIASIALMSIALGKEPALAQDPGVQPPPPPAPGVDFAPAPAPVADLTPAQAKSKVTVLENRQFCMDDDGNILTLNDRRLQVRRTGQTVEGSPSKGECLRVIAEGVADLKEKNGGTIPAGHNVKVVVSRQGAENKYYINPGVIPDIVNLGPETLNAAMGDPFTRQAIMSLHEGIHINVRNVGGLMTMTFKEKNANTPLALSVELEKQ